MESWHLITQGICIRCNRLIKRQQKIWFLVPQITDKTFWCLTVRGAMQVCNVVQWKFSITRSLGPRKFALYIIYFVISVANKQNKGNKFIWTGKISLLYQVFWYIRSLFIEFSLYIILYSIDSLIWF